MIKILGSSDDLIEILGHNFEDEFMLPSPFNGARLYIGQGESPRLIIDMEYSEHGTWTAKFSQNWNEDGFPWPVKIETFKYSVVVLIDAPKNTPISVSFFKNESSYTWSE